MKKVIKIILLVIITTMTACHSSDNELGFTWSQNTDKIVQEGIFVDAEDNQVSLPFSTFEHMNISTFTNDTWIHPMIEEVEGNGIGHGIVDIKIDQNSNTNSRKGTLYLVISKKTIHIKITQEGCSKITPESKKNVLKAEGGNIEIRVKSKDNFEVKIYPYDCNWAKVQKINSVGDNTYAISVSVNKNEGLGRIFALDFYKEGRLVNADCGPYVIQEPAPFPKDLTVENSKPGSLQVLLGNDYKQYRQIRFIKIIGGINGLDFETIKRLCLGSDEDFKDYPIDIDLTECIIKSGNNNPFEYYGWIPAKKFENVFLYGELPIGIFRNAINLRSIKLPNNLKIIGNAAFEGCRNIKEITIPNSVEEIGSKAFYGCNSLEEITINQDANLQSIGNQAFTTFSQLKSLLIPITAINLSSEAFLGCKVSKLHLKWPDPIEAKIVPHTENCILYVPKGSEKLYTEAINWKKFKHIVGE